MTLSRGRGLILTFIVLGSLAAGYVGARYHPDVARPSGEDAERAIAESLQVTQPADDLLSGDYVIERYYALEEGNGRRVVLDFCKGRIQGVIVSLKGDWTDYSYDLILDRVGLEADQQRLTAFVRDAAPINADKDATYLGLIVQDGTKEVFGLNYDGSIPDEHVPFRWGDGEGVFAFLAQQDPDSITGRQLIDVDGNNYMLTTADLSPQLRGQLGMKKAVVMVQLLLVDRTSRESNAEYYRASPLAKP